MLNSFMECSTSRLATEQQGYLTYHVQPVMKYGRILQHFVAIYSNKLGLEWICISIIEYLQKETNVIPMATPSISIGKASQMELTCCAKPGCGQLQNDKKCCLLQTRYAICLNHYLTLQTPSWSLNQLHELQAACKPTVHGISSWQCATMQWKCKQSCWVILNAKKILQYNSQCNKLCCRPKAGYGPNRMPQ